MTGVGAGAGIEGLFTKDEAIQILRETRPKLSSEYCSQQDLDEFYKKLELVNNFHPNDPNNKPIVIVFEGLDGCGKSTQAKLLASRIEGARLRGTPPESMKAVRECFDRYGGMVARAFYLISNYVLAMEMVTECLEEEKNFGKKVLEH